MLDSTNILSRDSETESENSLLSSFEKILKKKNPRIFIAIFSSNLERIKNLIHLAYKYQRNVSIQGRSLERNIKIAKKLGILDFHHHFKDSNKELIICTGAQAEARSAFSQIAYNNSSLYTLCKSDLFVLSAKTIPGNESGINSLLNHMGKNGIEVITPSKMKVHVSGHPCRVDLEKVYMELKATDFIPIHGESHFLEAHLHFYNSFNFEARAHLLFNGQSISFENNDARINTGGALLPLIHLSEQGHIISDSTLSQRERVAKTGIILISFFLKESKKFNIEFYGVESPKDKQLLEIDHLCLSIAKKYTHTLEPHLRLELKTKIIKVLKKFELIDDRSKPLIRIFFP